MIYSFQERGDLHFEAQLAFFSYFFAFLFPIPSRECILAEVIFLYHFSLLQEEYVRKAMPKILGTFDMTATFIVSIFLATTATTAVIGGPAAITYLVIAGVGFFLPCLIATAHLGLMFQYEGALYNWTHHAIGGRASFFAGFCAWFPGVLITTSLADPLVTYIQF